MHGSRFEQWRQERADAAARRTRRDAGVAFVSLVVLAAALAVQFGFGLFVTARWSLQLFGFFSAVVVVALTALFVSPYKTMAVALRVSRAGGSAVSLVLANLVLYMLYAALLPVAFVWGRRNFAKRHKAAAAWVGEPPWQRSTWKTKELHVQRQSSRRSPALRALGFLAQRRDYFLLGVALLVLVLALFAVFAHTSPLAPLVYTLF